MRDFLEVVAFVVVVLTVGALIGAHYDSQPAPMPTVLHWRGTDYPVRQVNGEFGPSEDTLGLTFCNAKVVIIDVAQRPDAVKVTLLHEVLHLVTYCDDRRMNVHKAIYEISPALEEFLQANPQAADYLKGN